jgi:uncharacterized protein YcbX
MHLSDLYLYPVKSLRGVSVPSATLDAHGLVGDRRFLVVDATGRFLTQRALPRMALIATALDATHLTLSVSALSSSASPAPPIPPHHSAPSAFGKAKTSKPKTAATKPPPFFPRFLPRLAASSAKAPRFTDRS